MASHSSFSVQTPSIIAKISNETVGDTLARQFYEAAVTTLALMLTGPMGIVFGFKDEVYRRRNDWPICVFDTVDRGGSVNV